MFTIAQMLMQMNDGVHSAKDFILIDDKVHRISPIDRSLNPAQELIIIPRVGFIEDVREFVEDDYEMMESFYGQYNSFAFEPGTNRYYAWYDYTR